MSQIQIKRALIAVYDKTGIIEFARSLVEEFGIEIISTGGTARHLKDAGIPVTMVERVTGFPEMLDGRVKTLHPKVHAAILADRDNPDHMRRLAEHGIQPIDMVVVNLYPFEQTVAKPDCTFEQAIEMIDIGGPCLLRAAAKNHKHVLVVCYRQKYAGCLELLRRGTPHELIEYRRRYARHAFQATWRYDRQITRYLEQFELPSQPAVALFEGLPALGNTVSLRYGENPHQPSELRPIIGARQSAPEEEARIVVAPERGEMSFNNYVDGDSALSLVKELSREAAAERLVWHRRLAGGCGTGVSPVQKAAKQPSWKPIDDEIITQRNLPHIQKPGRTYFVTFRLKPGVELPPQARDIVMNACHYWHGRKMTLHLAVVMPDHVHLLLTPYLLPNGDAVSLGELLHSIKSFSSHQIRQHCGGSGPVWLDENWDRLIRHEKEFYETWEYMDTNPERAKLPGDYRWKWWSSTVFEEGGEVRTAEEDAAASQQRTGETPVPHLHRRDAGATPAGATPARYAVAFIKHTNACGVAIGDDPVDTYRRAYLGDPVAAAGGVLCMNFPVTREMADVVMNSYRSWGKAAGAAFFKLDVWIAPDFDEDAVKLITTPTEKRKWGASCRLLAVGEMDAPPDPDERDYKKITGGMLVQTRDLIGLNEEQWKVVSKRSPTESEMADLRFAWLVCKHTKSNAITIVKDGMLLGNGAGQMSRVKSCDLAIQLARENGHADKLAGAIAAGDAFFPVEDGPQKLIDAGITAIIHPGGSNRDADSIRVCDEAGVAMIMTGTRHFKH